MGPYGEVLRQPRVRSAFLLGLLIRTPLAATFIILTLHVVGHLGRSYGEAGAVTMALTLGAAISGPWRGRLLDRHGLRRTIAPSLGVLLVGWSVAPWVGYVPLMAFAFATALYILPVYSIVRQAMLAAVPAQQHRTVLSLDSVGTEISFIVGPALGVLAATAWDTRVVLLVTQLLVFAGGVALWRADLPLKSADFMATHEAGSAHQRWLGLQALAILVATAATTLMLSGTDVGIVAAMRAAGHQSAVGAVLAVWSLTSLVGGLVYGAMHREVSVFLVLGVLSLLTLPAVFATTPVRALLLLGLAGIAVAPALTATAEAITRAVPQAARGEAMGWHGAAINIGSAMGAPIAGVAIDHRGPAAGFVVVALIGLLIAVVGGGAVRLRRAQVMARTAA